MSDWESAVDALRRARRALVELDYSRKSDDIERVRKGVAYELETAMAALDAKWDREVPTFRGE